MREWNGPLKLNFALTILGQTAGTCGQKLEVEASIQRWESTETLQTNTTQTGNDSRFQAFEAPCSGKGCCASEDMEVRHRVRAYCKGQTETLSAFLSSFKLFRIRRFLWCSSLSSGLLLAFRRCVDAETLSPCLQLRFVLQYGMNGSPRIGLGRCIPPEVVVSWISYP